MTLGSHFRSLILRFSSSRAVLLPLCPLVPHSKSDFHTGFGLNFALPLIICEIEASGSYGLFVLAFFLLL